MRGSHWNLLHDLSGKRAECNPRPASNSSKHQLTGQFLMARASDPVAISLERDYLVLRKQLRLPAFFRLDGVASSDGLLLHFFLDGPENLERGEDPTDRRTQRDERLPRFLPGRVAG